MISRSHFQVEEIVKRERNAFIQPKPEVKSEEIWDSFNVFFPELRGKNQKNTKKLKKQFYSRDC